MNPRIAFLGAPLLTLAYGVIRIVDGFDGHRGPGLAWTAGHLAFLGAMVLFVVVFAQMRRLAGRNILSTVLTVVAVLGAMALFVQFSIDIVAGFKADDHLAMSLLTADWRQNPVLSLFAYDLGPYLFYLGQLGLVIQLAATRRVKAWTPLLVLFDLLMPFIDKNLIPVGAVVLLVSFTLIVRRIEALAPSVASADSGVEPNAPALV